MKRITFQANEAVSLLMPWSEAMLHCRKADRVVRLRVVEFDRAGGCGALGHRVEWACDPGQFFPSGYTLTECGIWEEATGYSGWVRTAEDPQGVAQKSEADVQAEAARITALLEEALTPGAPARAPWKRYGEGGEG